MPAPTVADMLKYANLQMAAEALYKRNAKTDPRTKGVSFAFFVEQPCPAAQVLLAAYPLHIV